MSNARKKQTRKPARRRSAPEHPRQAPQPRNNAIVLRTPALPAHRYDLNRDQVELIKRTIAKGASDDELQLFLMVAKRHRLDPFTRQLHLIRRWNKSLLNPDGTKGGFVATIQIGIDGYRQMASRYVDFGSISESEYGPMIESGKGKLKVPEWAKVKVFRKGLTEPTVGVAYWSEYAPYDLDDPQAFMWRRMSRHMLAKCFTPDTQVLTDQGFQRFDAVTGKVLQVTEDGLAACEAVPFSQNHDGPMISSDGDMLNFSVTPNHDMITTVGTVEARAMYETSRVRPVWFVPLTMESGKPEWDAMSDADLVLAGAIAADASFNPSRSFVFGVSRPHKIELLESLHPASRGVIHSSGNVAVTATRSVRTNFDKQRFVFPALRVAPLLDALKRFSSEAVLSLSKRQARLVLNTWQMCDGYTNRKTNVRRLFTSRPDHVATIEMLAVIAGYSVNVPKPRFNDLSPKANFCITISEPAPCAVKRASGKDVGLYVGDNPSGRVFCVTVPSGVIIVRRNGFSMPCGNCAEALALRKAHPDLADIYTAEEMTRANMMVTETGREIAEWSGCDYCGRKDNFDQCLETVCAKRQAETSTLTPRQQAVAERKVAELKSSPGKLGTPPAAGRDADAGETPAGVPAAVLSPGLFYTFRPQTEDYEITGGEEEKRANRDLLAPLYNKAQKKILCPPEILGRLLAELESRKTSIRAWDVESVK